MMKDIIEVLTITEGKDTVSSEIYQILENIKELLATSILSLIR